MRVRIHRGAHEIGGSCVEVASRHDRIVLDVGKPLWAKWNEDVPLPPIPGLAGDSDPSLVGVVISHPHLDHYGLCDQINSSVPIVIGREAANLLRAATFFSAAGRELRPSHYLADRAPLSLGDFSVTPYLADHSAFDAYSLLVEADGQRLFYTGDIRGHGRKARLFQRLIDDPPRTIDVLLCEGTHIRSSDLSDDVPRTEVDVEHSLARRMSDIKGTVLVVSSAQNIDRLVSVYRACKRTGRILVTDLYTATIAAATGRSTIPQPGFPGFSVYVPNRQRVLVKEAKEFDRIEQVRSCRVFQEWLVTNRSRITLLMPSSAAPELARSGALAGGGVVWSMWPGYLHEDSGKRFQELLQSEGIPLMVDHTSGHASVADLQRLAVALDARRVIPIHTEGADRYHEIFSTVELHGDGEWWDV